jgi:hypothetical protein
LKGKLPYRDFETFYGPPNPFLLAVVYYIGGIGLTPERATGFAYRLIFLGAMFCLARRWNSTVASGCTLFAALFLVSLGVAAYAWTGRLACALRSIYLLAQAESRQCPGVAANGALLFRADFGPAVMLSALPVFWRSLVGKSFGISSVRLRGCSLSDASFS